MKTVLVIGGAGLVAGPLISQLRGQFKVKTTVKSLSEKDKTDHLPKDVEILEANILTKPDWKSMLDGINYVIYTAAPFVRQNKAEEAEILKKLHEDIPSFVFACATQKIEKLVFLSSCSTVYGGRLDKKNNIFDESTFSLEPKSNLFVKRRATIERVLTQFCQEKAVPFTVLLPGIICGPIPSKRVHDFPSSMMISRLFSQTMPFLFNLTIPLVDSRDVAKACVQCIMPENLAKTNGERIIICEGTHSTDILKAILKTEYKQYKIKFPFFSVPKTFISVAAKENPLVQTVLELLDKELVLDNSKSIRLIGMNYNPVKNAIKDEIDDLLAKNLIGKGVHPKPKL